MEPNNKTPRLGGGVGRIGGCVAAGVRVAEPDPAPVSAALAASLMAAFSFLAASSRVFLAVAARSAVLWASGPFLCTSLYAWIPESTATPEED